MGKEEQRAKVQEAAEILRAEWPGVVMSSYGSGLHGGTGPLRLRVEVGAGGLLVSEVYVGSARVHIVSGFDGHREALVTQAADMRLFRAALREGLGMVSDG